MDIIKQLAKQAKKDGICKEWCIGHQLLLHYRRSESVMVVIVHHEIGSDESGHISTRLGGEEVVDFPEILLAATGAAQSLVDVGAPLPAVPLRHAALQLHILH